MSDHWISNLNVQTTVQSVYRSTLRLISKKLRVSNYNKTMIWSLTKIVKLLTWVVQMSLVDWTKYVHTNLRWSVSHFLHLLLIFQEFSIKFTNFLLYRLSSTVDLVKSKLPENTNEPLMNETSAMLNSILNKSETHARNSICEIWRRFFWLSSSKQPIHFGAK